MSVLLLGDGQCFDWQVAQGLQVISSSAPICRCHPLRHNDIVWAERWGQTQISDKLNSTAALPSAKSSGILHEKP